MQSLAGLQKSGASHVVIYYHEGKGDVEYVRVIALGAFSAKANKPAPDDLIQQYGQGYATLGTWKDAEEVAVDAALPPLPIDKLTALARQLATTTDCSLDIIPLNQQAGVRLDSALHDAFAEEGQAPASAVVPAGAIKLKDSLHFLPPLGATHLIVTSFQNARGADVVNVSAKGVFTAEAQAKAKILLAAKMVGETSVLLGHYIDGEEAGLPKTETSKTERRAERKAGK